MLLTDPTIKTGFLAFLEKRLNRVLQLDPVTVDRLSALSGQIVEFRCHEPKFNGFVRFEDQRVRLAGYHDGAVDAVVSGSATSLSLLAKSRNCHFEDIEGLTVTGQPELIKQLQQIHAGMELDWESQINRWIGEVPGHSASQAIRFVGRQFSNGKQAFDRNITGYLQEELRLVPGRVEIEHFSEQVAQLQQSVQKLSNQINHKFPSVSDSSNS